MTIAATALKLPSTTCHQARLSRDARFDGKFFTAVKTTGIYCRPICPATAPKEANVEYFESAIAAARGGYRPCLRCRPDSAPGSWAWKGVDTSLERAIALIEEGELQHGSLQTLSNRLGMSDRYLRQLFDRHLGASPKAFALYQQCLFAKQLLHQTKLPMTQVALASGFNSLRRFNDCFRQQMGLTPTQVRKSDSVQSGTLRLKLYYRPPYDWVSMQAFLQARFIPELEWIDQHSYGRTFEWSGTQGQFTANHIGSEHRFDVDIDIDNISGLKAVVNNIKRILDVDTDIAHVQEHLKQKVGTGFQLQNGLRLPGIWSLFEAGIRGILGQQVSVVAARKLVTTLVTNLGLPLYDQSETNSAMNDVEIGPYNRRLFPSPAAIAASDISFLKMPESRKLTLQRLAQYYADNNITDNQHTGTGEYADPCQWLELKGIGPWTVDYAKMRGISDPDIYLGGDLGVKKALSQINSSAGSSAHIDTTLAAPWRSYLTFQLWRQL